MFVKIVENDYGFQVEGKVIARKSDCGDGAPLYMIRGSELIRTIKDYSGNRIDPRFLYAFLHTEVEEVQSTMVNCSDSNVGKGWGGFYDQAPIRKSKFRNH